MVKIIVKAVMVQNGLVALNAMEPVKKFEIVMHMFSKKISKIKVCILTTVHSPFDIRAFQKEARALVKAGYEVTLIAQHDKEETVDGIRIINLQRQNNRIKRMTSTVWEAYQKARVVDADIYHFHDSELIPVGLRLQNLKKKVIFDIHEDTRQLILSKNYIPMPLRYLVSHTYAFFEDYACKRFSALVTPQDTMTEHYSKLNDTVTVENFVDLSLYPHREPDFSRPVLLHAGTLDTDRGIFNMVAAAKKIKGDFLFYLAGKIQKNIMLDSLKPLIFLGQLNQKEMIDAYSKSNIGIILYNNVGQYSMAGALKCYEYMANSMPMIMPDFGEWVDFNKKYQCGINVNVLDAENVAASIEYLVNNPEKARQMGENGREWVEQSCSWQVASKKLLSLYRKVLCK
mgnify:CR=1 FL=1